MPHGIENYAEGPAHTLSDRDQGAVDALISMALLFRKRQTNETGALLAERIAADIERGQTTDQLMEIAANFGRN